MFDYDQALGYLSGLLKFGIKFGLDRFAELCRRMGDPQDSLRVIHVGGTNGKGSTAAFITSILRAAGYSVGTYLSPYVYDVRERIQINGEPISKDDFALLRTEIAPHLEAVAQTDLGQGTEFEAKTLMAFLYFLRGNVDYAVIEVGMGGRYDCTNVIHPLVSVITNVSLDHTERLGETIQKIAWDKAGIAKPGAPLVTAANAEYGMRSAEREGAPPSEPEECSGRASSRPSAAEVGCSGRAPSSPSAAEVGCNGRALSRPWAPQAPEDDAWRTIYSTAREQGVEEIWRVIRAGCELVPNSPKPDVTVRYHGEGGEVVIDLSEAPSFHIPNSAFRVPLGLAGDFQHVNAATAAAAVAALQQSAISDQQSAIARSAFRIPHSALARSAFRIPHSAFEAGLASAYLPGRLEVLRQGPTVVIDAAHNPDAADKLRESLPKLFRYRRLILVIGMLSTHSAEGVVERLAPLADEIIATAPQWAKARPASEIAEAARLVHPNVRIVEPVPAAVRAALDSASEDDLILVTGSFYTIGEVDRRALGAG